MSIKNIIISFVAIIALYSCTSTKDTKNDLPSWYISPKNNNHTYLHGVGEGFTLQEAKRSALKEAASRLKVNISSESSTILEENNYAIHQEFRQKIKEQVEDITFTNYQVTNSAQIKGKIYTEITIDYDQFIREYKGKLAVLNKKMRDLYKNSQNKTILKRRNALSKAVELSIEGESIINLLSSLYKLDYANQNKYFKQYNLYRSQYDKILDQIEFFVQLNQSPKSVGNVINNALNKDNLKIVKSKNRSNKNLVVIDVKSSVKSNNIYGSNVAKLKINFSLLSNQNKILASNLVEVSGSSVISKNEAVSAASANLAKKIDSKGILTILGIDNK